MSRVTELEKALTTLFRKGTEVGYTETEIDEFLENIDYHALLQAVWNKAETVYAYRADGKNALSLDYRSSELFKQRATLLYEDVGDSYIGAVFAARSMELWLLEDGLIPNYYEGELSGEVLLDGKNISGLPLYETAKYVGSVFQNPRTQFFTVDSTSELAFGCENQGLPEEEIIQRVKSTAEQFDMDNLLGKNIFSLSGGEKQKIACASVSASNPPIIVLDEPSSNLDMSATKDLRRMIQIWKQQGKTVIIAEHRLYYLKELIDRVVYLKDGKIEKDYSALDALKLSVTQQAEMGLRPFDLGAFPVTAHPVASSGSIECENFHFAYTKQRDALDIDSLSLPQAGVIAVIGHMDANEVIVRLTREDFASEKEFLKWKALSDEDYHASEKEAHVYRFQSEFETYAEVLEQCRNM